MKANTGVPAAAMAAAAWSWVEKMLQEAQRTSAPSAFSVSISTAVWMVMCSEPAMRAPLSGLLRAVLLADRHQAGHLGLGDGDFLAAPVGEPDVLDDVIFRGGHDSPCWLEKLVLALGARPAPSRVAIAGPYDPAQRGYKEFFI